MVCAEHALNVMGQMSQRDNNKIQYDVVITGGGLAGMSLACVLGTQGIRVACVDRAVPLSIADKEKGDLRTTAISYGSRQILDRAGVWQDLDAGACPIKDIHILDGDSPLLLNFLSDEVEGKAFGWIVENIDLRFALQARMAALESVTHIAPATVEGFKMHDIHGDVITDQGVISGTLLVGADGRRSFMRGWMEAHNDLQVRQWQYDQRAVICTVTHQNPHNNIAVEHFFPQGPFAVLPMADDPQTGAYRSSVVFTEHGPECKSLMRHSDQDFEILLSSKFPEFYREVSVITPRAAYPLGLVHAAEYIAPRMVLVADAAHGIHPIAGQGLNLGFRDIAELGRLLSGAHEDGGDLGDSDLLGVYQRRRRPDNMAMVAVTDGLNRLFSNNKKSVRTLRRFGLKAVAKIPLAKQFFMRQAMGDRSR